MYGMRRILCCCFIFWLWCFVSLALCVLGVFSLMIVIELGVSSSLTIDVVDVVDLLIYYCLRLILRQQLQLLFNFLVLFSRFISFFDVWCVLYSDDHCVQRAKFINYYFVLGVLNLLTIAVVGVIDLLIHYCLRLILRQHLQLLFNFLILFSRFISFFYVWCVLFGDGHCVRCAEFINYYFVRCSQIAGHYCVNPKAHVAGIIILLLDTCSIIVWLLLLK